MNYSTEELAMKNSSVKNLRVLFLCTANSSRSQMAEGLLRELSSNRESAALIDGDTDHIFFDVESAGSHATQVREEAVLVMSDIGIDISKQQSKSLEKFINEEFDYVITVCNQANETCPFFPNAKHRLAWDFPDPAELEGTEAVRLAEYTIVRGQIAEKIREFYEELVISRRSTSN